MRKRTAEEQAIMLMRLFSNWLEFWIEDQKEGEEISVTGADFGILQIEGLQKCLERVKSKLQESKESGC